MVYGRVARSHVARNLSCVTRKKSAAIESNTLKDQIFRLQLGNWTRNLFMKAPFVSDNTMKILKALIVSNNKMKRFFFYSFRTTDFL